MVEKPETVVSNMCRELQTKTSHFNFPAVGLIQLTLDVVCSVNLLHEFVFMNTGE